MSGIRHSSNGGTLILVGAGILCFLCGFVMISERTTFASMFLDAKVSLGSPVSNIDHLKILWVEGSGIAAIGQGAVIFVVGLFRLIRTGAPQSTAVKPLGR